jgi:multiple sugar transport system substrate-binding protein
MLVIKRMTAVLAVSLLLFTVGCFDEGESSKPASRTTGAKSEEITYYYVNTYYDPMEQALDNAIKKFEEAHPGAKVNTYKVDFPNYYDEINRLFNGGNAPDVISIGPAQMSGFVKQDYVMDLLPFVKADGITMDDYFDKGLLTLSTMNNKLIGIPMNSQTMVVVYNKRWFDKAGLEYPKDNWTWEQFADTASKLKDANPGERNTGAAIPCFDFNLEPMAISKGGGFLSPDGTTTEGYLDGKASVESFGWLRERIRSKTMSLFFNGEELTKKLRSNETGMGVVGYDFMISFSSDDKKNYGVVGLPHFDGGARVNAVGTSSLAVSSKSKNPKLAWEFIKYIAMENNEAARGLSKVTLNSSKKLEKEITAADPFYPVKLGEMRYASSNISTYRNMHWNMLWDTLQNGFAGILIGDGDIQTALTELTDKADLLLSTRTAAEENRSK